MLQNKERSALFFMWWSRDNQC